MVTIYSDDDGDLSLLANLTIAVIGYGNQGRAQALNLRDSGLDVVVGCAPDAYAERAREDGLPVLSIAEAAEAGRLLLILLPDEVQPEVYAADIAPGLRPGDTLDFASGYNIHYGMFEPPADVDVVLVAPRMIGEAVRSRFLDGRGFPCLVAAHQDASGSALGRALALARGIGGTKAGAFASSFKEETLVDLFAEQFLWAGIGKLCRVYFEALVEAGCSPEAVASEMYLSGEMVEVAQAMIDHGFFRQLDVHSHTSQYGQLSRADAAAGSDVAGRARKILAGLQNGAFAKEWAAERARGCPTLAALKKEAFAHPLNDVERELGFGGSE
jgi:ketol-acid reductoisomerase